MIGLIGYVFVPTAPPWMFPSFGFVDGVNHSHGVIGAFANPYAAMPSLHAADALVVGVYLFVASRHWWSKALWAFWPAWVWFCVLATANHFWLDVARGHRRRRRSRSWSSRRCLCWPAAERPPAGEPIANLL